VAPVNLVSKDPLDSREELELLVHSDRVVTLDHQEIPDKLDPKALLGLWVSPETLDRLALVLRVLLVQLDRKDSPDPLEFKDRQVRPVLAAHKEAQGLLVRLVQQEPLGFLDRVALLAQADHWDHQDLRDRLEHQDQLDHRVNQVNRDLPVLLDQVGHLEIQESRVSLEVKDLPEILVRLDRSDHQDRKGPKVPRGLVAVRDSVDLLVSLGLVVKGDLLGPLVALVSQDRVGQLEILDSKDCQVSLVLLGNLVHRVNLVQLGHRVYLDPLELLAELVQLVKSDRLDHRALRVPKVLQDLLAARDKKGTLDLLEELDRLDRRDYRVAKAHQAHRDSQDQAAYRVPLVHRDHPVIPAFKDLLA